MKRSLTALGATASAFVAAIGVAAPAHAAVPSCTTPVVVATQVTPHPLNLSYDFVDVATATAACVDLSTQVHTAQLVFEWWYYDARYTAFKPMPSCPDTVVSPAVPWVGAIDVVGAATCHRPPESLAFEVDRIVCVDLLVDGVSYFGTPEPGDPGCTGVLLNPTIV